MRRAVVAHSRAVAAHDRVAKQLQEDGKALWMRRAVVAHGREVAAHEMAAKQLQEGGKALWMIMMIPKHFKTKPTRKVRAKACREKAEQLGLLQLEDGARKERVAQSRKMARFEAMVGETELLNLIFKVAAQSRLQLRVCFDCPEHSGTIDVLRSKLQQATGYPAKAVEYQIGLQSFS